MQPLHGAWPVGTLPRYAFRTLPANGQTLRRRPLESSRSQSGQVFPHLMARPQITYNFHHYLAVNFVVPVELNVYYGYSIPDIVNQVRENVSARISDLCGLTTKGINITVIAVEFAYSHSSPFARVSQITTEAE